MKSSDLVITGVGMVTSIGMGRSAFTQSLLNGVSGVRQVGDAGFTEDEHITRRYRLADGQPHVDPATAVVANLVDFDGKLFVKPRKALKVMCREIQTAYAASQLAVDDAGLNPYLPAQPADPVSATKPRFVGPKRKRPCYTEGGKIQCDRIGTIFGSEMMYGSPQELSDAFADSVNESGKMDPSYFGNAAMRHITPLWLLKYLPNMPACHFSIVVNAHGPNNSLTVGDTSGQAALIEACGYLRREIADFIIVSAAGTRLNETRTLFTEDQPLATVREPVSLSSRPHALDADGIVRGEGAGGLVLERGSTAKARGAEPLAHVLGYASRFIGSPAFVNDDRNAELRADAGRGSTAAIVAAISGAMQMAGITLDDVGAVIGHAVGDPVIDACEREALFDVLPGVPVVLPGTLLGHVGAASGMMGVLAACVTLQSGQIAPVPHASLCNVDDASTRPLAVSDQARTLQKNRVIAIAHTSPGHATAIVLSASRK